MLPEVEVGNLETVGKAEAALSEKSPYPGLPCADEAGDGFSAAQAVWCLKSHSRMARSMPMSYPTPFTDSGRSDA